MDLQIYIDETDIDVDRLEEIAAPIQASISTWIDEQKLAISLLTRLTDNKDKEITDRKLGIHIRVKSKFKLKEPLNFLYQIAKTYKCEFVIALIDIDSGSPEEICYFGYEEGRPDLFEIANYLSL